MCTILQALCILSGTRDNGLNANKWERKGKGEEKEVWISILIKKREDRAEGQGAAAQ